MVPQITKYKYSKANIIDKNNVLMDQYISLYY